MTLLRNFPVPSVLRSTAACLLLGLSACGGGGGGGGTSSGTTAPPVATNQPPQAAFSPSSTEGFAPLQINFDAGAANDPDGTISSYEWDFGDGSPPANGMTTSHVYADPGAYNATLSVTDNDGASSSTSTVIRARGVSVSGEVAILSSSAVDSDVNDRLTAAVSNNDFANAQRLGNPVLLGGYVNLPGTGPLDPSGDPVTSGNLYTSGDDADIYAISLSGNELILLSISEPGADLDLALYDAQGNFIDASLSLQATESLIVNTPGDYFIEVFPASGLTNITGASNYVLSVGQNLATTSRSVISRVSDPFIGGELLLASTREAEVTAAHGLHQRARAGRTVLTEVADDWSGPGWVDPALRAAFNKEFSIRASRGMTHQQRQKYRTLLRMKALKQDLRVTVVEPNTIRQPHLTPDDQFYGLQWHYPAISLPAAWDITTGASAPGENDVIVAVIDSGVLLNHPDLSAQLVPGYDFISDPARARDGDGIDPDPNDEGDLAFAGTSSFHGTHVAGTVAARSDNGEGVAGVAWGARLMPLRALGVDGGSSFDVIQAVRFAAGLANDSGTLPAQPADIINLSLGSSFFSASEQALYNQVRDLGIIVVASAGNESSSSASFPSGYQGVLSVSATDINNNLAPYSNFGASIDLAAPGGYNITDQNGDGIGDGVVSTLADDSNPTNLQFGYAALSGTSMAAPHVAGVIALMKSVHPELTPDEFSLALLAGDLTDDLGSPGRDESFGSGRINAQKAVLAALALASGTGSDPGPILGASTSALNFGVLSTQETVTVANLGTGSITIADVVSSEPWLSATPDEIDANGIGSYLVNLDRSNLADGSYSASLIFQPDDPAINSVSITVVMQVSNTNPDADAGLHYVILVNDTGGTVGPPAIVAVDEGTYTFRLEDIPPGNYRLFAGSDMDDDSFLCDAGEACGSFRTLDAPEQLVVDPAAATEITDVNLVSEFRAVITTPTSNATGAPSQQGLRYPKPIAAPAEPKVIER